MKTILILFVVTALVSCQDQANDKMDDIGPKNIFHGQILTYATEFLLEKTFQWGAIKNVTSNYQSQKAVLFLTPDTGYFEIKAYDGQQNVCLKNRPLSAEEIQNLRSDLFKVSVCEYMSSDPTPMIYYADILNLNYCYAGSCKHLILSDFKINYTGMYNCLPDDYKTLNIKIKKWAEELVQSCE